MAEGREEKRIRKCVFSLNQINKNKHTIIPNNYIINTDDWMLPQASLNCCVRVVCVFQTERGNGRQGGGGTAALS